MDTAHPTQPALLRRTAIVLALLVGLIASLVAGAQGASAKTSQSTHEHNIAMGVLRHINHERAVHHLKPLTMNADLVLSARRHDLTMARFDEMSHQLPGESFFADRIRNAGYRWMWAGENIAWNSQMTYSGVVQLQKMMYNERAPYNDHRLNILNSHYKNVGVDVYLDSAHHKVWLTTDFGARS